MKITLAASLLLASWATAAPVSLDGKILEIYVSNGKSTTADRNERPSHWQPCTHSPLYLHFPANGNNSYSYQLHESTEDSPWPPVVVTYRPKDSAIWITGNDMHVDIQLYFTSGTTGTADVAWHEEESSWYVENATFQINTANITSGYVAMPQEQEADGATQSVDDGLRQLVQKLEQTKYKTAVERLYQKRLLTLLPQIMEGGDINNVLSNANGTTALHNACGLSHVEIVQWLVDHGADLNAKTAKGASVDACVGGPNAKAIRAILRKARDNR
ncbi:MAG: ankyrin repeat domain-containing protein [Akkermansia sp.]|nr:ankyrin repeat domain-containing protein [Akkermansia sp.]